MNREILYRSIDLVWTHWSQVLHLKKGCYMKQHNAAMQTAEWNAIQEENLETMDEYFQHLDISQHLPLLHDCNQWSLLLHEIMDNTNENKLLDYAETVLSLIEPVT